MAALGVVEQVLPIDAANLLEIAGQILTIQNGCLLRLIVVEAVAVNRKSELDGPVEQVRLGEAEGDVPLQLPVVGGNRRVSPNPRKLLVE